MKQGLFIVILCSIFMLNVRAAVENNMLKFQDESTGKDNSESINSLIKKLTKKQNADDTTNMEGSGNDDEDSDNASGSGEEESSGGGDGGEGSGGKPEKPDKPTKKPKKTTPEIIDINEGRTTKTPATKKPKTTMGNNVEEKENPFDPQDENNNIVNQQQQQAENQGDNAEGGISFTHGIIIGVVVGSILAILIIIFLVYRLRKKDEGSYSLDDQSSTQFIRDNDSPTKGGKEYFA